MSCCRIISARRLWLFAMCIGLLAGCAPSATVRLQARDHYRLAQSYFGNGTYRLSEQEIRKALDLLPDAPRYLELLALIQQAQGHLRLAEETYRMALKKTEIPPSVFVNYSALLLLRGRLDEAIAMAQQALRDPEYDKRAWAYTNIGLAYLKQGALIQAAEQFRTALESQPDLPEAHHNLGLVYARLGAHDKAIGAFREAIRYRSSYVEAHVGLGNILLEDGHTEEARLVFERVIALAPDSDMAIASRKQLKLLTP